MAKIYWFTGQPGAGKTVLAKKMVNFIKLIGGDKSVFHVDGDDIREIWDNMDYSREGRMRNITNAQALVEYLSMRGYHVVVSLVSPYREQREIFKDKLYPNLEEIYVHTSEERGKEEHFAENYEAPLDNYIDINTTKDDPDDSFQRILAEMVGDERKLV